ncbi:unnamed protein product [Didymodactylos carnosus]|uniref:Uncharacterized protein n=1 Tax=Didymodactylos carnosus TaxID=1234261 RepID=A0A815ZFP0_9BILA|nr:unnamed protein product [Didymodactylos carnosus]CAF4453364.1 unnamed protein product [Didymodactylos carnosus]
MALGALNALAMKVVDMTVEGIVEDSISDRFADVVHEPTSKEIATSNNIAKARSIALYIHAMEEYCGGDRPYIHPNPLEALHNAVRRQSLVEFRRAVKLGDDQVSQSYQEVLDGEMSELFSNYKKHNET